MRPKKIWGEGYIKNKTWFKKMERIWPARNPAMLGPCAASSLSQPRAQPACLRVFGAEANRDYIRGSGEQAPHEESFPEQVG